MMIRLALLLHSQSPQAYRTLRETGVLRLPGEASLHDYTIAMLWTHHKDFIQK
jgi:hypothetical protein